MPPHSVFFTKPYVHKEAVETLHRMAGRLGRCDEALHLPAKFAGGVRPFMLLRRHD